MALVDEVSRIRKALEYARLGEANRVAEAIQTNRVVGVLGEAEVGKSETIRQAIGSSSPNLSIFRLDLDAAASDEHAAFLLAKAIASTLLGPAAFSTLKGGVLVPAAIESRRVELANLLGVLGLEEALRDWPSGRFPLRASLAALEAVARRQTSIFWVDHLEAPTLTPRHPFDLDKFLWAIREMTQRLPALSVLLSGREAIEGRILGSEAAFHQQGQWLSLDCPPSEAWQKLAAGFGVPSAAVADLEAQTGRHPATMMLALLKMSEEDPQRGAHEVLRELAASDTGLAARAMQHARSLHRLGGQVLVQVAQGTRPYAAAQRGRSPQQEITKVLGRLRLAGLLRHDERWSLVNPLVGIGIRGQVALVPPQDWELDDPESD